METQQLATSPDFIFLAYIGTVGLVVLLLVLVVECLPATSPVFLSRDNEESFFVRMSNTTQALKPSEMLAYVDEHFR